MIFKSPHDLGFFDPSPEHDFPEICLYHDIDLFLGHIKEYKYRQESVLQVALQLSTSKS